MSSQVNNPRPSGARKVGLWVLQIVTAVAFLAAGVAKLTGQPMMVETFEKVGVGQWLRYLTGAIEIGAAVLLLIPRLAAVGAALLACTMAGAVLSHRLILGGSPVPALVLGALAAVILWGRFATLKSWWGLLERAARGTVTGSHRALENAS
jgi:putative oxidoreductase